MTGGTSGLNVDMAVSDAHFGGASYLSQVYHDHNCPNGSCAFDGDMIMPMEYQVTPGIAFQLDAGGAISGQVLRKDAGTGIASSVTLYAANGSVSNSFHTNADGTFVTSGLTPGTYYLAASPLALGSDYGCIVYASAPCGSGYIPDIGQPIVITGTQDVSGTLIQLPNDKLFGNGFE